MLGIKLNNRFLDLKPGTTAEIERKSPFFAINDIALEVSTEISIPYTANNAVALDMPYQYYTARQRKKYAVEHYDGEMFRGRSVLVIETGKLNLNNIEATEISGNLLYGISDFFQDIKGKYLTELELGGERTFNWTTGDPTDGSAGFWQHIHATWTDGTIPYVFAPVRNKEYAGTAVDWMNGLGDDGKIEQKFFENPVVPFIRTRYLLECIFNEFGWEVDFTGLNDSDWEKLIWINTVEIDWYSTSFVLNPATGLNEPAYTVRPVITFKLANHLPKERTISDFLVQLFNRYGWAPVFNNLNKKCRLVAAKELRNGTKVDWTQYASPAIDSSFSDEETVFGFTNEIDSNDEFPSEPDFEGVKIGPPAATIRYVPPPSPAEEKTVRYCFLENQWFIAKYNDLLDELEWVVFADNIYNEDPEDSTETISTTISTLPIYLTLYRGGGTSYYGYFPLMKQSHEKDFGYRSLLYHGMKYEIDADGSVGPMQYPLASSTLMDNAGNLVSAWSNVYKHPGIAYAGSGPDYGIIKYWLQPLVDILKYGENTETLVNLPLTELYKFTWDQVVHIQNLPFLVTSIVEPIPYSGYIMANLKRLVKAPAAVVIVPPANVYARLTIVNIHADYFDAGPNGGYVAYQSCDVEVDLFSDALATIPYTPPATGIDVVVATQGSITSAHIPNGPATSATFNLKQQLTEVYTRVMYFGESTAGEEYHYDYYLMADPMGIYTVI